MNISSVVVCYDLGDDLIVVARVSQIGVVLEARVFFCGLEITDLPASSAEIGEWFRGVVPAPRIRNVPTYTTQALYA